MTNASPPDDSDLEQPSDNDNSWERSNQELQKQLEQRIRQACQSPTERQRQKKNNEILRLIQESGKLRCDGSPHCGGCLQQVSLYFFENLCEVNRKKYPRIKIPFCEEPNIIGRLKLRLDGCIVDAQREAKKDLDIREPSKIIDGEPRDPVDQIPAPMPIPLPCALLPPFLLTPVRAAVEADKSGELRRCHIENYPEANCQVLILQQLSPQVAWSALADQLGIPILVLNRFYDQQCKPLIEKISEQQLILYVRAKIEADETGELRECYIEDHPEVNAQVLILQRLPPVAKWKDLAKKFDIPSTTLSGFYQRQCKPRLKAICEQLLNLYELEQER